MDKIRKSSLADEAYKIIKKEITSDKYVEGSIIPSENQLSKKLSVSRVVVREALSRLREENEIVTYQGKGSYRANPINFGIKVDKKVDFDKFSAVMDFRFCIETYSIQTAVKVATDSELMAIKDIAEKMAKSVIDKEKFTELDYQYHFQIVKCAHNELLVNAIQDNKQNVVWALKVMNNIEDALTYAIDLHKSIAEYLIKRDAKKVIKLLKNNGEYNVARIRELIERK